MKKIISVIVFMLLLLLVFLFTAYVMDNEGHINDNDAKMLNILIENKTELTLYSNQPMNLTHFIYEIKNEKYFEGYDNETLYWLKSLKQKDVYFSDKGFVLMDKIDSNKVADKSDVEATDTGYEYYISCVVLKNCSLTGNNSRDVLLVNNVDYMGNRTFYYDV